MNHSKLKDPSSKQNNQIAFDFGVSKLVLHSLFLMVEMIGFWLKGLIIGLTVAIPVGPVGLFCLDNTVTRGKMAGMSCATGMVLADIFSACIMIVGLNIFYDTLLAHKVLVKVLTSLLFAGMGISIIATRSRERKATNKKQLAALWLTSFILSVSPATFGLMLYLFPALGLIGASHSPLIVTGVAFGSALWCMAILFGGSFIRRCLGQDIKKFKTVVGCVFILFGMIGVTAAFF